MEGFTHFDSEGRARMVDVSGKEQTHRVAVAQGIVCVNSDLFDKIKSGTVKKGDVLGTARIAGIMAAKRTPDIIPMCHTVLITGLDIFFELDSDKHSILITARVSSIGATGVEMEALTAVSVAALTIYDMCKAVQRDIVIVDVHLIEKAGGVHGHYKKGGARYV